MGALLADSRLWTGALPVRTSLSVATVSFLSLLLCQLLAAAPLLRNGSFEKDEDGDGLPDGWYNFREATRMKGGPEGDWFLRFEAIEPGRPVRASQAFAMSAVRIRYVTVSAQVRLTEVVGGATEFEAPQVSLYFTTLQNEPTGFVRLGPWTGKLGWLRMAREYAVPASTEQAVLTIGLLGATGAADFDDVRVEGHPPSERTFDNLLRNGDFRLGETLPDDWTASGSVGRTREGVRVSGGALSQGICLPLTEVRQLTAGLKARSDERQAAGELRVLLTDKWGRPSLSGLQLDLGALLRTRRDWTTTSQSVRVPPGADFVLVEVRGPSGSAFEVGEMAVTASDSRGHPVHRPLEVKEDSQGWLPYVPAEEATPGSALDVSFLLDRPAGKHGFVTVQNGQFVFSDGEPVRFLGANLLPGTAFPSHREADALASRLAASGFNLVRPMLWDSWNEPSRNLFCPWKEGTTLSAMGLERFDYLVSQLRARGIYVSLELLGLRKFRSGDDPTDLRLLPAGARFAAIFDQRLIQLQKDFASAFFKHRNPYTGLVYAEEPAVALVVLLREGSLRFLREAGREELLPEAYRLELERLRKASGKGRETFYRSTEEDYFKAMVTHLRSLGVKVPVAGSNLFDPIEKAFEAKAPLDYAETHLYWQPALGPTAVQSHLRSGVRGLAAEVVQRLDDHTPFVLSEWGVHGNEWCNPYLAGDLLPLTFFAWQQGWGGIAITGVFRAPWPWGDHLVGTCGQDDAAGMPFAINSMPQVFAQFPHAALLYHSGPLPARKATEEELFRSSQHRWDPEAGTFVLDTPTTQGVFGFVGAQTLKTQSLEFRAKSDFAAVVCSSLDGRPIKRSQRLLLTAVGQAAQTGMSYTDFTRRRLFDRGVRPILLEPVRGTVRLSLEGDLKVYALDSAGKRLEPVAVTPADGKLQLLLPSSPLSFEWEIAQ